MPKFKYFFLKNKINYNSIVNFAKTYEGNFHLFDCDKLFSELQIIAAYDRIKRVGSSGPKVKNEKTLLPMYMAGTNQINKAIEEVGIDDKTTRVVIAYEDERAVSELVSNFPELEFSTESFLPFDDPKHDSEVFTKLSIGDLII